MGRRTLVSSLQEILKHVDEINKQLTGWADRR
jgi:hypothetical protein